MDRSRRALFGSMAVPLSLGLAGCTDETPEDVESIRVRNWHVKAHTVVLVVRVDGNERVSRTVEVSSVTEREDGVTEPGDVTIEKTLPGPGLLGRRRYEVTVRLDDRSPETQTHTTGEGFDSIVVRIGEDESLDVVFEDAG